MIAHVAGIPVEELVPLAAGAGGALALTRLWLAVRLRRPAGRRVSHRASVRREDQHRRIVSRLPGRRVDDRARQRRG